MSETTTIELPVPDIEVPRFFNKGKQSANALAQPNSHFKKLKTKEQSETKRCIVQPAELDLDTPGHRNYYVALEHDSIWGDHLIPLSVWVGPEAEPGKGLVAFGSTHGNEVEGPIAIHHLMKEIDLDVVRGRIILIPILNPSAFKSGTREAVNEDGVNLNRAFVPGAGKTPALSGITHRIAAWVRDTIWPRVHVVIDLHSGGGVSRFELCSSFHPVDDPQQSQLIEETARWFGTPLVMTYQNQTPGLLPSEAERLGKITVGTELGWGNAVNVDGVRYGRQGVWAAAIHHDMMYGEVEPLGHHRDGTQRRVSIVDRECYVCAPFTGHFEPLHQLGDIVRTGTLLGWLHDFDRIDLEPQPIYSQVDGIVLAQAWEALVTQGQHIVVVAQEREWEAR